MTLVDKCGSVQEESSCYQSYVQGNQLTTCVWNEDACVENVGKLRPEKEGGDLYGTISLDKSMKPKLVMTVDNERLSEDTVIEATARCQWRDEKCFLELAPHHPCPEPGLTEDLCRKIPEFQQSATIADVHGDCQTKDRHVKWDVPERTQITVGGRKYIAQ